MAGFTFELERLLEHRRTIERDRQREVAALERRRVEIEREIGGARQSLRSMRRDLASALGGADAGRRGRVVDAGAIRRQSTASLSASIRLQDAGLRLSGVRQRLDEARARLSQAMSERKAVELLKDRRYRQWKRRQERREDAELEDAARGQAHAASMESSA